MSNVTDMRVDEEAFATLIATESAELANSRSTIAMSDVTTVSHVTIEVMDDTTDSAPSTLATVPSSNGTPIVPPPAISNAPSTLEIVPSSDVTPSFSPTLLELPDAVVSKAPFTPGAVSTRQTPRRSSRRKSAKPSAKKRALEVYGEIEYANAVLSASKFCNFPYY